VRYELSACGPTDLLAIAGAGSLLGLSLVSSLIEKVAPQIPGRLLLLFPGRYDAEVYRLLDARDGWNYRATNRPIEFRCSAVGIAASGAASPLIAAMTEASIAKPLSREALRILQVELAGKISKVEAAGLRQLFGVGPNGAQDLLNQLEVGSVELPRGVTVNTLKTYGQLAQVMIDLRLDDRGTQALRLMAVQLLLNQ
jgi:hypothetical protein